MAFLVTQYIKLMFISPGYNFYLNIGEEMITRNPIVDAKLNHQKN